jgi:CheY-like chemotaxis protein
MYALALSARGFDVVATEDADEAYRRAWEIHPDIMVADLPMLNPESWPFLENLKQTPRTRGIPVVAMAGFVQRSVEDRIDPAGFAALFPKPCLPDELAVGLRQVLQRHSHVPQ